MISPFAEGKYSKMLSLDGGLWMTLFFSLCCSNIFQYSKMNIYVLEIKKKKDEYHLKLKQVINMLIYLLNIYLSYHRCRSYKET